MALTAPSCSSVPTGPNDNTWRFLPGRVEQFSFAPFREGRRCWIYLPPGYATSGKRYPVLYVNDGDWAFDGSGDMHVNRICEDLIRRGEIEPIIVVAIDNGGGNQRFIDYAPGPDLPWGRGGGDFYLRAIRDTLKPEVDRRYRTLRDPANTAMSGESLGGLISVYAAYAYDSTFGKVGAFSPTYGWDGPWMLYFVRTHGRPRFFSRFYQDTGYPDDNGIVGMESIALDQGFVPGLDFMSVTVRGAVHWTRAWEHRYPDMLRFLFKPRDAAS